jgi:hypothetical protein
MGLYDSTDGGAFTSADYRIAARYGIDLDAPEQVKCGDCGKRFDADKINDAGYCATCAAECRFCNEIRGSKKCCGLVEAAFIAAPTMAG